MKVIETAKIMAANTKFLDRPPVTLVTVTVRDRLRMANGFYPGCPFQPSGTRNSYRVLLGRALVSKW
jgi:hypothetical protein